MVLKTFIADVKKATTVIKTLSSTSDLSALKTAISGLSKEQALLVLSTQKLSNEQKEQLLLDAGLLGTKNKLAQETVELTAAKASESIVNDVIKKDEAEALLIKAGLITQEGLEKNAIIQITQEKWEEVLANEALSATDKSVIASALGITTANGAEKLSFDALTTSIFGTIGAIGKLLISNPIGWAILAAGAIFGAVKAYEALTISLEEAKEQYDETRSELESIEQEMDNISSKIDEINSKDNLSITDKEDLENLKEQNKELKIRQKYLKKRERNDAKQLAEKASEKYNSKYGGTTEKDIELYRDNVAFQDNSESTFTGSSYLASSIADVSANEENHNLEKDSLAELIAQYELYSEKKKEAIENEDAEALAKYDDKLNEVETKLIDARTELQGFADSMETAGNSDDLAKVQGDLDLIDKTLLSVGEHLTNFINDKISAEDKNSLIELAESGELTGEILEEQFSDVNTYLKENGIELEDLISILGIYKDELEGIGSSELFSKATMSSEINKISGGFDSLGGVYSSVKGSEPFDFNLLIDESFTNTFSDFKTEYDNLIDVITESPNDIDACQEAFDDLLTVWINSTGILDKVTEENVEYTAALLKQKGVANADEVATNSLIRSKAKQVYQEWALSAASGELEGASYNLVAALEEELNMYGLNETAMSTLSSVFASAQVAMTNALANGAEARLKTIGTELKAIQSYADALSALSGISGMSETDLMETANGEAALSDPTNKSILDYGAAQSKINAALEEVANLDISGYNGGNPGDNGNNNGGGDGGKQSKQLVDWIERKLSVLQTKAERWAKIIENATDEKKITKYYNKLEANYRKQAKTAFGAASEYLDKANTVRISKKDKTDTKLKNLIKAKDASLFTNNGKGPLKDYKTLLKEYGESTANGIQKYQEYYDKYQSSIDSYIEACENLYNAPIEEAAKKIETLADSIELIEAKLENVKITDYKTANDLIDKSVNKALNETSINVQASKNADQNFEKIKKEMDTKGELKKLGGLTKDERAEIVKAVKAGKELDITKFTEGSDGYLKAIDYNTALKKKKEAKQTANVSVEETKTKERQAKKDKFDNVVAYYENEIEMVDHGITYLDDKIAEIEAKGTQVNVSYYKQQMNFSKNKKTTLENEKKSLLEYLDTIPKGTEEWADAYATIQKVDSEISKCTQDTIKWADAISQANLTLFENIDKELDRMMSEQEHLRGLMAHEENVNDETAEYTEAGLAKLALYASDNQIAKTKVSNAKTELKRINSAKYNKDTGRYDEFDESTGKFVENGYSFASIDAKEKAIESMYDTIREGQNEVYKTETEIYNLEKERYEMQIKLMEKLVAEKKESLSLEKEMHDYANDINDKTKNISTLEKQIAAYSGNTSEEGLAKLQKLQVQLAEAEEELRETEYDRMISDQQNMLDKLSEEYNELISKKLKDFQGIVEDGLGQVTTNTNSTNAYLKKLCEHYGYDVEYESSGDISKTGETINNATEEEKSQSGLSNPTTNDKENNEEGKERTDDDKQPGDTSKSDVDKLMDAIAYVESALSKAKKKKDEYSDVNKKLYSNNNKKVLSANELKGLASILGIEYDNASKKGKLYKELERIHFPGFSSGGIVSVDSLNRQIKRNGDDGLASVKNGEAVLTPIQSKQFKLLASKLSELNSMIDMTSSIVKYEDALKHIKSISNESNINQKVQYGDMSVTFEFPNVTDSSSADSMIREIQKSPKLQKTIRSVSTDLIAGKSRLAVNRIK